MPDSPTHSHDITPDSGTLRIHTDKGTLFFLPYDDLEDFDVEYVEDCEHKLAGDMYGSMAG